MTLPTTPDSQSSRWALRVCLAVLLAFVGVNARGATDSLQWYQHYERGLAAISTGDHAAALAELAEALVVEPRPRERIRTYGNRFLFAYDPYFHQARCYLALGDHPAAASALASSDAAAVTNTADRETLRQAIRAASERLSTANNASAALGASPVDQGTRTPSNSTAAPPVSPAPAASAAPPPEPRTVESGGRPGQPPPVVRPPFADDSSGGGSAGTVGGAGPQPSERREDGPASTSAIPAIDETPTAPASPPAMTVTSTPPGANILLDGQLVGNTPLSTFEITAGSHQIELQTAGVSRWSEQIEGRPGVLLRIDVALPTVPATEPAIDTTSRREGLPTDPQPPEPSLITPTRALGGLALLTLLVAGHFWRRRRNLRATPRGSGATGRVGPYLIEGELGRGGMAVTYRARRRGASAPIALKIPHPSGDPTYRERFVREGKLGETLHHPNIVRIVDVGVTATGVADQIGEVPYLAMELLPGRTLRAELDERPGGLPLAEALAIVRSIAEALDYAHGKGVVHRDLKPENIMRLPDGSLRVMDFGVARVEGMPGLTTSQVFFGSPLYAAPESVEPRRIDRRTDLYAVGVLLYELLVGSPPFVHESVFKVLEMQQNDPLPAPPPNLSIDPQVWALVLALTAKDPAERPQSAQALLVELDLLESGKQGQTATAGPPERTANVDVLDPRDGQPGVT